MSSSLLRIIAARSGSVLTNPCRTLPLPNAVAFETPAGYTPKVRNNMRVVSTASATSSAHSLAVDKYHEVSHKPTLFNGKLYPFAYQYPSVSEHQYEDEVQEVKELDVYLAPKVVKKTLSIRQKKMLLYEQLKKKVPPELQSEIEQFKELFVNLALYKHTPIFMEPKICSDLIDMMGDIKCSRTAVLVVNPGSKVMTEELVRRGVPKILVLEPNEKLFNRLMTVHTNDQVTVYNRNLVDEIDNLDEEQNPFNSVLHSKNLRNVKVIIYANYKRSLQNKLLNLLASTASSSTTVEIFSVVPSHISKTLNENNLKSRSNSFQLLWNMFLKNELIGELSAETFYPPYTKNMTNPKLPTAHVIRSTLKRQIRGSRQLQPSDRQHLIAFASQFRAQSLAPVIGSLEKWSPGVGVHLIMKGIQVFTPFQSLTSEQYLNVFFTFLDHTSGSPVWDILCSRSGDPAAKLLDQHLESPPKSMYITQ